MIVVVDTNVAVVANGRDSYPLGCIEACIDRLHEIQTRGQIVLDNVRLILTEYINNLSLTGQPGVGDAFLKWVLINQNNPERCPQVPIHPKSQSENDFLEFPAHPGLARFDPSDRKFVAVSWAHPDRPPILQALDSKWWGFKDVLRECEITVEFLCPEDIKKLYQSKKKPKSVKQRRGSRP